MPDAFCPTTSRLGRPSSTPSASGAWCTFGTASTRSCEPRNLNHPRACRGGMSPRNGFYAHLGQADVNLWAPEGRILSTKNGGDPDDLDAADEFMHEWIARWSEAMTAPVHQETGIDRAVLRGSA